MSGGLGLYSMVSKKFHLKGNVTIEGWWAVIIGLIFFAVGCFAIAMIFYLKKLLSQHPHNDEWDDDDHW